MRTSARSVPARNACRGASGPESISKRLSINTEVGVLIVPVDFAHSHDSQRQKGFGQPSAAPVPNMTTSTPERYRARSRRPDYAGRVYVKICGIDTEATAAVAIEAGADAIGVVMNQTSARRLDFDTAAQIVAFANGKVDTVLVTNDMDVEEAAQTAQALGVTALQLHGANYTREDFDRAREIHPVLWRATSLNENPDVNTGAWGEDVLLLDAPVAGSGEQWDHGALEGNRPHGKWLLAGGLDPGNVESAIEAVRPWGVDVSSGVEAEPGVKDQDRVRRFIAAAKSAQQ